MERDKATEVFVLSLLTFLSLGLYGLIWRYAPEVAVEHRDLIIAGLFSLLALALVVYVRWGRRYWRKRGDNKGEDQDQPENGHQVTEVTPGNIGETVPRQKYMGLIDTYNEVVRKHNETVLKLVQATRNARSLQARLDETTSQRDWLLLTSRALLVAIVFGIVSGFIALYLPGTRGEFASWLPAAVGRVAAALLIGALFVAGAPAKMRTRGCWSIGAHIGFTGIWTACFLIVVPGAAGRWGWYEQIETPWGFHLGWVLLASYLFIYPLSGMIGAVLGATILRMIRGQDGTRNRSSSQGRTSSRDIDGTSAATADRAAAMSR